MVLASSGALTIADLVTASGAGPEIARYLELRGIKAVGSLALIAGDDDTFQRHLLQPLLDGYQKGTETVSLEDSDKAIASAVLRHMWQEARMWWTQRQANMAVAASPTPPASGAPPASSAGGSGSVAADKVPKTLPAGVWSKQVSKYNSEKLRGRDRSFPEELLLGAEVVLARMWHEHHVSKMYTPTLLGEILSKRSFTATGEVNMLAKNPRKSNVLTIEDEQLVQEDEKVWSPRSVLSIMDGIEAVVWAWILLEIGEEHHCQAFGKWCVNKARSRSQKLEQFKQWWDAAGWKIAMRMRAGATFGEASAEVWLTWTSSMTTCHVKPPKSHLRPGRISPRRDRHQHPMRRIMPEASAIRVLRLGPKAAKEAVTAALIAVGGNSSPTPGETPAVDGMTVGAAPGPLRRRSDQMPLDPARDSTGPGTPCLRYPTIRRCLWTLDST